MASEEAPTVSSGAACTIIAAATSSKIPASIRSTLPPMSSSAGVPISFTVTPSSSATAARPSAAPTDAAPFTLCPQAWPMPGRASYSAQNAMTRSPVPYVASTAVGRPPAPRVTSKPASSMRSAIRAAARCSSRAVSGSSCRAWLSPTTCSRQFRTAPVTVLRAVGVSVMRGLRSGRGAVRGWRRRRGGRGSAGRGPCRRRRRRRTRPSPTGSRTPRCAWCRARRGR